MRGGEKVQWAAWMGLERPATPLRHILIERGRINRIAEAATMAPGGVQVLDVAGKWVMPGLMDLHAHNYRPAMLSNLVRFGITTVRD